MLIKTGCPIPEHILETVASNDFVNVLHQLVAQMVVGKYVAPEHVPAHLLPTRVEGENVGVRPWAWTLAGVGRGGPLLPTRLEGGDVSVLGLDPGRNRGAPCSLPTWTLHISTFLTMPNTPNIPEGPP